MSRSFTIHYDQPFGNDLTFSENDMANESLTTNASTTTNTPNYCAPGGTQPNCIGFTKQPSSATSQMMIYVYIGIGGVILIMVIALLLNSSRVKKVKESIAVGDPQKIKMGVSW